MSSKTPAFGGLSGSEEWDLQGRSGTVLTQAKLAQPGVLKSQSARRHGAVLGNYPRLLEVSLGEGEQAWGGGSQSEAGRRDVEWGGGEDEKREEMWGGGKWCKGRKRG